jgi:hypothetical protein
MKPQFRALTDSEEAWLSTQRRNAVSFALAFSSYSGTGAISLEHLDEAYSAWFDQGIDDPEEVDATLGACSAVLGDHFVNKLGFEWGVLTDEFGTDISVRGRPGTSEFFNSPLSFVGKRWHDRVHGYFAASFRAIETEVIHISSGRNIASNEWGSE